MLSRHQDGIKRYIHVYSCDENFGVQVDIGNYENINLQCFSGYLDSVYLEKTLWFVYVLGPIYFGDFLKFPRFSRFPT